MIFESSAMAHDATRPVILQLLVEIVSRYERGAEELTAEFDLPEITAELLMHVCLAAPQVDDLILGFVRDDLRVVSLSEQTRQMVQRDVGLLERDSSRWMRERVGALGRQLTLKDQAEAAARLAQGGSSELEEFILTNRDVAETIRAMKHSDLVRWVMLSLMRESNARQRGSAVIAAWREQLAPKLKERVQMIHARYSGREAPSTRVPTTENKAGARVRF